MLVRIVIKLMTWYEILILSYIELLSFFIVWSSINKKYNNKWCVKIIIILTAPTILLVLDRINISIIGPIINFLIVSIVLVFVFKVKLRNIIYEGLIVQTIIICIQMGSMYILKTIYTHVEYRFTNGLIVNCITIIGCFLVSKFVPLNKIIIDINKYYKIKLILFINILAVMIFFFIWRTNRTLFWQLYSSSVFVIHIWTIVNFFMFYQIIRLREQEKQLHIHEKYIPSLTKLIDEVRSRQHDFDNHLNAIYGLTEVEDSDIAKQEIKGYLKGLIKDIKPLDKILSIKDHVLSAIIYSKKSLAESKNVNFELIVANEIPTYPLNNYELVEVIGNLLDNAIESAEQSSKKSCRKVVLTLGIEEGHQYIDVRNVGTMIETKNVEYVFKKRFSTKKGSHRGYGLYNVKKIINKYNGTIELCLESKDTVFRVCF